MDSASLLFGACSEPTREREACIRLRNGSGDRNGETCTTMFTLLSFIITVSDV